MTIRDARDLHADITKLLFTLEQVRSQSTAESTDSVVQVELTGGSFKTPS
jgi:hypothetical protein